MPSNSEINKLAADIQALIGVRVFRATLGNGSGTVDVPGQPGMVYIQYVTASGVSQAHTIPLRAPSIKKTNGAAVIIEKDPADGVWCIRRPDFTGLLSAGTNPTINNVADDNNSYWIAQQRIVTLASHPISSTADSMEVTVQPWSAPQLSDNTFKFFGGEKVDLTSSIPAGAGEWCLACLFLKTDMTIEVVTSTAKTNPDDLGFDDIEECLAGRSADSLPVWAWRLYNGQTGITPGAPTVGGDDFWDLRGIVKATFTPTVNVAPADAHFVTSQAESGLSNEVNLGALTTGLLKHTVSAGVSTPATAVAGTDYNSPTASNITNYQDYTEASTPSTPSADHLRVFAADDNGVTVWRIVDSNGTVLQTIRDQIIIAENLSGSTRAPGYPVQLGSNAGHTTFTTASITGSSQFNACAGVLMDSTANAAYGRVMLSGIMICDTSGFSANAALYLSSTGTLTATPPAAGTGFKQLVAKVLTSSATGLLQVLAQKPFEFENLYHSTINIGTGSNANLDFYGTASRKGTLKYAALTADRTTTIPDATGTVVLADATQTLTNKSIVATQIDSGTLDRARLPLNYICIRDEKAQNTAGGTATSGSFQTRTLNTISSDAGSNVVSLSSNQITLVAGTYYIRAHAPAFNCNQHQAKLYNATDAADIIIGTSEFARVTTSSQTHSFVEGRFTIAASKALELQHRVTTTQATNGFGVLCNFTTEVYSVVELWREA